MDSAQLNLAERLDLSLDEINKKRIFRKTKPQRFYIHGEVGRGKTFLMDMFFQEAKTKKKTRLHFHRFMKSLHDQLKEKGGQINPVQKIVRDLVKKFDLLSLSDFHLLLTKRICGKKYKNMYNVKLIES